MWEGNKMEMVRYSVQDGISSKREMSKSHDAKSQMAEANNMLSLHWDSGEIHFSQKSLSEV